MTTKKTEKKPTETTWKDLPRKEREKLAKLYRRDARLLCGDARGLRKQADGYDRDGFNDWAKEDRASAKKNETEACRLAALADLIERNLGRSR